MSGDSHIERIRRDYDGTSVEKHHRVSEQDKSAPLLEVGPNDLLKRTLEFSNAAARRFGANGGEAFDVLLIVGIRDNGEPWFEVSREKVPGAKVSLLGVLAIAADKLKRDIVDKLAKAMTG